MTSQYYSSLDRTFPSIFFLAATRRGPHHPPSELIALYSSYVAKKKQQATRARKKRANRRDLQCITSYSQQSNQHSAMSIFGGDGNNGGADGDENDWQPQLQQLQTPLLDNSGGGSSSIAGSAAGDDDEADGIDPEKDVVFPYWLSAVFRFVCRCTGDDNNGSANGRRRRKLALNHNVFLNLVTCVLYGVSDSLSFGTVMVAYLKRLGHETNSPVGNVEAVNGLAALISALPIGYLADKIGRSKVIRAGGFLFLLTAGLNVWLLEWIGTDETKAPSRP